MTASLKDLMDRGVLDQNQNLTELGRLLVHRLPIGAPISSLRFGSDITYRNPAACSHKHQRYAAGKWECVDCGVYV